mmetsp:Transcript_18117/g.45806  ORF Transcript_18117/g.45806 Transcript_18117/m.45806 type:complete len:323 (-) Transcript_18117:649-1617(-)
MEMDLVVMDRARHETLRNLRVSLVVAVDGDSGDVHHGCRFRSREKPRVVDQRENIFPLLGVGSNHARDQIDRLVGQPFGDYVISRRDFPQEHVAVVVIKRQLPRKKLVDHDARAPNVDLLPGIALAIHLLGRQVPHCAHQGRRKHVPAGGIDPRVAKIRQLDVAAVVQKHIIEPNVAMTHAVAVAVVKRVEDLAQKVAGDIFGNHLVRIQPHDIHEGSAAAQFEDEEQVLIRLQHFHKIHDALVLGHHFQGVDFSGETLQVFALLLRDDLHGKLLLGDGVHGVSNDPNGAAPKDASELVIARMLEMAVLPELVLAGDEIGEN